MGLPQRPGRARRPAPLPRSMGASHARRRRPVARRYAQCPSAWERSPRLMARAWPVARSRLLRRARLAAPRAARHADRAGLDTARAPCGRRVSRPAHALGGPARGAAAALYGPCNVRRCAGVHPPWMADVGPARMVRAVWRVPRDAPCAARTHHACHPASPRARRPPLPRRAHPRFVHLERVVRAGGRFLGERPRLAARLGPCVAYHVMYARSCTRGRGPCSWRGRAGGSTRCRLFLLSPS